MEKGNLVPIVVVIFLVVSILNMSKIVYSYNITVRVQPITLFDVKREYVCLEGQGEVDVVTIVAKSDPEVFVEEFKQIGERSSVRVKVYVVNASSDSFLCTIVMASCKPFSVNLYHASDDFFGTPIQSMTLPSNVSVQIEIPIFYSSQKLAQTSLQSINYYPAFPAWAIAVYIVFTSMFIATAYFDKSSLRSFRKRWDIFDTFALTFRYIFYSSTMIFLFVTCGVLFESIIAGFGLLNSDIHIGDWFLSLALFAVLALLYGICNWRGIFDNINEEY